MERRLRARDSARPRLDTSLWVLANEGSPKSGTQGGCSSSGLVHSIQPIFYRGTGSIHPSPGYRSPLGPTSSDHDVTLPQECPSQWRGQGGRLPSCHRLIAYKVPYKHIVSRISCFQCRPAGLHNAPPACSPALSWLVPVHA